MFLKSQTENMKTYKTVLVLGFALGLYAGLQMPVHASPIFPAADNQPLNQAAEKTDTPAAAQEQNTSTETANLHKDISYDLAEVNVQILYGTNQGGKKAYKTTYQLSKITADHKVETKEPRVNITYKSRADKGKYAVEEISIKKMVNNAYQITAKIIESKPGNTIAPKVIWID